MPQLDANGITIIYDESGSGQPLLLLHGTQSDRRQFHQFGKAFGAGIRVIAYDQRDATDSPYDGPAYTMADHADDCAAFIEALGLQRAHLFGASYGGIVAMITAIRHPDRVQSLVIAASPPAWSMVSAQRDRGVAVNSEGLESRDRFMIEALLTPAGSEDPELVAAARAALVERPPEAIARRFAALTSHDCRDELGRIRAPTLILHGADDQLIPPATAEWMAQAIAGSELRLLEGNRHGLTIENAVRNAAFAREFVMSHPC
jgi:3-oxoadipate enol-lactonase